MITKRIEETIETIVNEVANDGNDAKMERVQILLRQAAINLGNRRFQMKQEKFKILKGENYHA